MKRILLRLWNEQTAQDVVEYALLLLLIALLVGATAKSIGYKIRNVYSRAASSVSAPGGGTGGNHGGNIGNNGGNGGSGHGN
jgi:Flp pilus assembly pilin Flp